MQTDVLCGRGCPAGSRQFYSAGSKRLITERGMFGNNLDVLSSDLPRHDGGYVGAGGGSHHESREEITESCALPGSGDSRGWTLVWAPDDAGLLDGIIQDIRKLQRDTAQEMVAAIQGGAPEGADLRDAAAGADAAGGHRAFFAVSGFASGRSISSSTAQAICWAGLRSSQRHRRCGCIGRRDCFKKRLVVAPLLTRGAP